MRFTTNVILRPLPVHCEAARELARSGSGADALGRILPPFQPSAAHYTVMAHMPSWLNCLQRYMRNAGSSIYSQCHALRNPTIKKQRVGFPGIFLRNGALELSRGLSFACLSWEAFKKWLTYYFIYVCQGVTHRVRARQQGGAGGGAYSYWLYIYIIYFGIL